MNKRIILNLLGNILLIEGAFMALPIIVGMLYHEASLVYFVITMVAALGVGALLSLLHPANREMYAKEGFIIVALGWILLSLVGALPFFLSGQIPNYLDAVFEAISGFSTTGASILINVEILDNCMLFWRSFTHWLGGMGVLMFILAVVPQAGGQSIYLMRAESPGPSVSKIMPKMRRSAGVLYGIYLGLSTLELILLLAGGMPLFDALCNTFATAGTGGFGLWSNSIAHYESYYLQGIITVFMVLFSTNFNIFFFLLIGRPRLALHNTELRWFLAILCGSIAAITWNIHTMFPSLFQAFHHAAFTVSSIMSTTGFSTANFDAWPEFSRIVLVFLMFTGGCAGSTCGGIKVSRIIIMVKNAVNEVRRLVHPRSVSVILVDGKRLPEETLQGVNSFMLIYIIVALASILLVSLDNFDTTSTVTAVIATLNNIGPGLNLVGATGNYAAFSALSKIVMCLDMLFGRLELFPMLILLTPGTWRKK